VRTEREKFEKTLAFFGWLERQIETCDGCGLETTMYASVFVDKYRYRGSQPEPMRYCEHCWQKMTGAVSGC